MQIQKLESNEKGATRAPVDIEEGDEEQSRTLHLCLNHRETGARVSYAGQGIAFKKIRHRLSSAGNHTFCGERLRKLHPGVFGVSAVYQ